MRTRTDANAAIPGLIRPSFLAIELLHKRKIGINRPTTIRPPQNNIAMSPLVITVAACLLIGVPVKVVRIRDITIMSCNISRTALVEPRQESSSFPSPPSDIIRDVVAIRYPEGNKDRN
jgi:hypothetical protein